jgi:hypothetical protein
MYFENSYQERVPFRFFIFGSFFLRTWQMCAQRAARCSKQQAAASSKQQQAASSSKQQAAASIKQQQAASSSKQQQAASSKQQQAAASSKQQAPASSKQQAARTSKQQDQFYIGFKKRFPCIFLIAMLKRTLSKNFRPTISHSMTLVDPCLTYQHE